MKQKAQRAQLELQSVIKIQSNVRVFLAKRKLYDLRIERDAANMNMEYADDVATKCLEHILGYSLSTYKPHEVTAI
jgi:hypothetical protein